MPEVFFVLLRFFLRVDNVLVKINDTRYYHEFEKNYVLREYTSREAKIPELKVCNKKSFNNIFKIFIFRFPLISYLIRTQS